MYQAVADFYAARGRRPMAAMRRRQASATKIGVRSGTAPGLEVGVRRRPGRAGRRPQHRRNRDRRAGRCGGMVAIASLLVVIALSLLVVRIGTIALTMTGLAEETARFQALSAY